MGRREHLTVFGHDYDTIDGTGVRDYIHVVSCVNFPHFLLITSCQDDLAEGHVAALKHVASLNGCTTYNLGTGAGVSVLQMVNVRDEISSDLMLCYKNAMALNDAILRDFCCRLLRRLAARPSSTSLGPVVPVT